MYLVWKERTVHRLKDGLQEADTEGSFRVGYLKRIVGCHGVVHVIELRVIREFSRVTKVVPR